ncbi:MAG TPA: hypothetical protein DCQ04_14210 [Actinobacteria bacterium]|jgi:hypothetical protein|nr:hypothetical protein [Actinomycetota bacterium]
MARLQELDWFDGLSADAQGWVSEVVNAGIERFLVWLNNPDEPLLASNTGLGSVPTAAAHAVTLGQTVELISTGLGAIEPIAATMAAKGDEEWLLQQIARYGREIAFAAALVYARVAEQRGARTARQSSDLVDALITGRSPAAIELLASRVGFTPATPVRAAACVPTQDPQLALAEIERSARKLDRHVVTALHEGLIVAVWATRAREHPLTVARQLFGPHASAVVAGPVESIIAAGPALRRAIAGLAARPARPRTREVLEASDLLSERALIGELAAQDELVDRCFVRLRDSGTGLLETVDVMFDNQGVLEQAAKALPVHVNTLRYRLDRIAELTGFDLRDSRGAFAIFTGVSLGRMRDATGATPIDL